MASEANIDRSDEHVAYGEAASDAVKRPTPNQALKILKDGNRTFMKSKCLHIEIDRTPDPDCKKKQYPIAVIVGCSDSRVPPELVFSQGLGDLFVIRSAGNTIDAAAMGSLEYAVQALGTPLIVVMGHQCCGAVEAAYQVWRTGRDYPGSMSAFINPILPAVIDAGIVNKDHPDKIQDESISENVKQFVKILKGKTQPIIGPAIKARKLRIVGARYDFDGKVDFIV